jgi:aldose 1-epimerase
LSEPVTLRRGGAEASLLPLLGGAIGGFTIDGRAILRPTSRDAIDPLETACFPLIPYANRIAGGCFTFAEQLHVLPPNHPVSPHPLHGLGWLRPWTIMEQTRDTASLTCSHAADEHWPWDWTAVQRFALSDRALQITLQLTNTSHKPLPAGLGLHPYFMRKPGDVLRFAADGVWDNDGTMIPIDPMPAEMLGDFKTGVVPAGERLIDNTYFGWSGVANWGETITLKARGAGFLHVFAPPGEDFVCLEPTSQMPDALNQSNYTQAGGIVLEPGATGVLQLEIGVSA